MKAAVFDIETSDLAAVGSGILLCACVRPLATRRTRTFRLDDSKFDPDPHFGFFEREEKTLLTTLLDELAKYDLLVGQNIENFDLPFLRSRAARIGTPFNLSPITYDTMKAFGRTRFRTVLNRMGKPTKSLDMIADFLGIDQLKTKIYPAEHWKTVWGNDSQRMDAMNELVDHCRRDVAMNTDIYEKLLPVDEKVVMKRWHF